MSMSVIIPALNEEKYIKQTLTHIHISTVYLLKQYTCNVEVIVVDNGSSDRTADIALSNDAKVIREDEQGIARATNIGAKHSEGSILIFIDADTIIPESLLTRVYELLSRPKYVGGAVEPDYRPKSKSVRIYLRLWAKLANYLSIAQGVTQFSTRDAFEDIGGYNESLYMSEDIYFYWKLSDYAKNKGLDTVYIDDIKVEPSCRRLDQWPLWKTILWTNPITTRLFLGSKGFWRHWYDDPPR